MFTTMELIGMGALAAVVVIFGVAFQFFDIAHTRSRVEFDEEELGFEGEEFDESPAAQHQRSPRKKHKHGR